MAEEVFALFDDNLFGHLIRDDKPNKKQGVYSATHINRKWTFAVLSLVCYTAVFGVVTQRSSNDSSWNDTQEERCVTTLKTAV